MEARKMISLHRLPLLALAAFAGVPALAQDQAAAPPPPVPEATPQAQPACTPEHAAMGHCTLPSPAPATPQQATPSQSTCTPEHAAMGHCSLPAPQPAQPAACSPEHAAMGHCVPIATL